MLDLINEQGFGTVEEYQEWHGLKPDGNIGRVTKRSLLEPRICGLPDKMAMANVRPWRKRHLKWRINGILPNISRDQFRHAAEQAFGFWQQVCGLTFEQTTESADIVMSTGAIDGPMSTLAYSGLPNGTDQPIPQKYDADEPFVISLNPPRHMIGLIHVMCHEIGHAIGLVHEPMRSSKALLNPTYDRAIFKPQKSDIQRVQAMYGMPKPQPGTGDSGESDGDTVWVAIAVPRSHIFEREQFQS